MGPSESKEQKLDKALLRSRFRFMSPLRILNILKYAQDKPVLLITSLFHASFEVKQVRGARASKFATLEHIFGHIIHVINKTYDTVEDCHRVSAKIDETGLSCFFHYGETRPLMIRFTIFNITNPQHNLAFTFYERCSHALNNAHNLDSDWVLL